MPGKEFVSKRETDILLISKYLNGELNTKAMHRLERRAQDDPFLMDALEGYDRAADDQKAQLDELGSMLCAVLWCGLVVVSCHTRTHACYLWFA